MYCLVFDSTVVHDGVCYCIGLCGFILYCNVVHDGVWYCIALSGLVLH